MLLQAGVLKAAGVDKVVAVTVGDPKEVQQWAATHGFDKANMVGEQWGWTHTGLLCSAELCHSFR
jgi:peroxiredoxin